MMKKSVEEYSPVKDLNRLGTQTDYYTNNFFAKLFLLNFRITFRM